jgi:hypothetical protein
MTAMRSGWISADRGRNDTGVSGAKLAGPGFRLAQMLAAAFGAGRRRPRAGDFARARRFTAGARLARVAALRRDLVAIASSSRSAR